MNFTEISLLFNNYPVFKAEKLLQKINNFNKKEKLSFIDEKKKEIVKFHFDNNVFYKSFIKNDNLDWQSLPVLTKLDLQIPLEKRLSKGFLKNKIFINKTSGSTGNPFYFAKDKFTHALTWATIKNRFNWHNLFGKKQARFYGIPNTYIANKKEKIKDFFLNRYRFNVFDLSDSQLEKWIDIFNKKRFIYLNGYTTVINFFARFLISRDLVLKDICPTLKACVVTSEMLFEKDKIIMEKAFGVPIINEYGASELDLIAFQDKNQNWILNTETIFVEVLDDDNKPLKDGEIGNLVVTSLYNKAHPFIRYKIGDKGAIKKIDSNHTVLSKLEGRSEDLIKLPSGKVSPGLTFYYITKSIMQDSGNIKEIKIYQTEIDTFKIDYVSKKELIISETTKIKTALIKYLEPNLKILFNRVDHIERLSSGKLKQFTSLLKNNK